jgi:hypothetical protein
VEQEHAAIARQQQSKHVSGATNQHMTIDELLELMFDVWSALRLYNEAQWEKLVSQG